MCRGLTALSLPAGWVGGKAGVTEFVQRGQEACVRSDCQHRCQAETSSQQQAGCVEQRRAGEETDVARDRQGDGGGRLAAGLSVPCGRCGLGTRPFDSPQKVGCERSKRSSERACFLQNISLTFRQGTSIPLPLCSINPGP